MNLDLVISQVQENIGLTNMSDLENLNFINSQIQENMNIINISNSNNFSSKYQPQEFFFPSKNYKM